MQLKGLEPSQGPVGVELWALAGVAGALPTALRMARPATASAAPVAPNDAALQAFWDTMIPGRKVAKTEVGNPIDPKAILGVDPEPGAVEADALLLGQNSKIGFTALT